MWREAGVYRLLMRSLLLFVFCSVLSAREMRFYVLGLLYQGPKWTPEETKQWQAGHLANINKMAPEGKLAGPMAGKGELRGIWPTHRRLD